MLHVTGILCADRIGVMIPFYCPFKMLTGLPCPGCGMTKAVLSLAKGDFQGALVYNPFVFFLMFMTAVSIVPRGQIEKRLPASAVRWVDLFLMAVLVLILLFWFVVRLIPACLG
jgi:hypothetical protein